ncbi:helix-turn-helix domain-containing protein [Lacticaseibacillus sp. N501-2]|uniref:helix-turn-helix domain-containing protein n=1 Tax=Lacticaseibacillus salsurae TaxID=3367729 RepID=UPI0038B28255
MTLIERVKKYAKIRGWNLKETALKSGLSENAIYGWKNHQPAEATVLLVAKTLGVTYEDLTGTAKSKEPTSIDLKAASDDPDTIMSWNGRPIPPEEMEMIRRILDGGK